MIKVIIYYYPEETKLVFYEYHGNKLVPSDEDWRSFGEMEVSEVEEEVCGVEHGQR